MEKTPNANRKHIVLFGNTNAGKSSILNALVGQEVSLVSEIEGTTTDAVRKPMELLPVGPVVLIDTAGLHDESALGEKRMKKTRHYLFDADLALYIVDGEKPCHPSFAEMMKQFEAFDIATVIVVNKADLLTDAEQKAIEAQFGACLFISSHNEKDMKRLKDKMIETLQIQEEEPSLLAGLVTPKDTILLVMPMDSAAPKGRLILPQAQVIREGLDNNLKVIVVKETELAEAMEQFTNIKLVVTDSKIFGFVSKLVPKEIALTSFSILMARQKGDIGLFMEAVNTIRLLKDDARILIVEACTHNKTHEDIGTVLIPKLLREKTKKALHFDFVSGRDFPEEIERYDLIIHCGSCMLNRKHMLTRQRIAKEANVPMCNYGLCLAYLQEVEGGIRL